MTLLLSCFIALILIYVEIFFIGFEIWNYKQYSLPAIWFFGVRCFIYFMLAMILAWLLHPIISVVIITFLGVFNNGTAHLIDDLITRFLQRKFTDKETTKDYNTDYFNIVGKVLIYFGCGVCGAYFL